MSSTLKLIKAFDDVKNKLRKMPLEEMKLYILQDALNDFWLQAPWRWTVGQVTCAVTAANTDQTIVDPGNILYLLDAIFTDGQTAYGLHPESFLSSGTQLKGIPNKIAYVPSGPSFRLNPIPQNVPNANSWTIYARYKIKVPVLTPQNIITAGTQLFDDEYFTVYKQAVLYYAYLWGDDQRAGSLQFAEGKSTASGQLGVYLASVEKMKMSEPLITDYSQQPGEERNT